MNLYDFGGVAGGVQGDEWDGVLPRILVIGTLAHVGHNRRWRLLSKIGAGGLIVQFCEVLGIFLIFGRWHSLCI